MMKIIMPMARPATVSVTHVVALPISGSAAKRQRRHQQDGR